MRTPLIAALAGSLLLGPLAAAAADNSPLPRMIVAQAAPRAVADAPVQINELVERAKKNDAEAQFQLGVLGLSGRLGPNNARPALELLARATDNGHDEARFMLATLLLHGRSVVENKEQALKHYRIAAEKGHAKSQNALAQMLLKGEGGTVDEKAAFTWFQRAADQELPEAQSNLGLMYVNGTGVAADPKKALQYFKMAAERGVAGAQHNVAYMLQHGQGAAMDIPAALEWYRRAANNGYAQSQFNLGLALIDLEGKTGENVVEAVKWLTLASSTRNPGIRNPARAALMEVSAQVGPEVVTEAAEAARMWTFRQHNQRAAASPEEARTAQKRIQ